MKGLLKFITCGSVDDGKSTLIGHILYDAKLLYADQEKALEQTAEALSWQIHLVMKSTPETWQWELPLRTLRSFFWMRHRVCWCRQDVMQGSVR